MYEHPARGQPGCRFDCSGHGRPPIIPGFEREIAESLVAISELVRGRDKTLKTKLRPYFSTVSFSTLSLSRMPKATSITSWSTVRVLAMASAKDTETILFPRNAAMH